MCGTRRFSVSVISTGGPAQPGWNGEISRRTRGAPGRGPDPSTPLRSAQDDTRASAAGWDHGWRNGFTLIELLVVISIVVLLMVMLLPALSRARKQGRAVVCQANLKQWGVYGATIASDNDGSLRTGKIIPQDPIVDWLLWGDLPFTRNGSPTVRVCPMANRLAAETLGKARSNGGTFLSWGHILHSERITYYGSYGMNGWHFDDESGWIPPREGWRTTDVRGANRVPVMLDSASLYSGAVLYHDPPECDAIPVVTNSTKQRSCINRHNGGVNGLFLDWSVRKVGLKELWTLKWYRQFDTAGPWTKAGGVQSADWPQWMRQFKAY